MAKAWPGLALGGALGEGEGVRRCTPCLSGVMAPQCSLTTLTLLGEDVPYRERNWSLSTSTSFTLISCVESVSHKISPKSHIRPFNDTVKLCVILELAVNI